MAVAGHAGAFGAVTLISGRPGAGMHGLASGDYDGDGAVEVAFAVRPRGTEDVRTRWAGLLTPYLPIGIDIRPAAEPNVLLQTPGSVLTVGISSARTAQFAELDPASFRLASTRPTNLSWRDFDDDGRPDLQLYFDGASLQVRAGISRLSLFGRTRRGVTVAGADAVTVVPASVASATGDRQP